MARTAKRYQTVVAEKTDKRNIPRFQVGIYSRLSVDNNDRKAESIENQIEIIRHYIRQNNENPDREMELVIYDEYVDRGISGTTFERDGFERLMSDVKKKLVTCIIVKDFSRFGRDYIEAGNLIEKILPFLGVRFIAVADHFDSMSKDAADGKLAMNIKNLVNDMYAKDISKRVTIARKQSADRGSYIGSFAPFGYDVQNENGFRYLTINKEAAVIVRRIYEDIAAGKTPEDIVEYLLEKKVHRISDYNRYGHVYCYEDEVLHQWNNSVLVNLIRNQTYAGDMVQGKHASRLFEGQKKPLKTESDAWIIVENTHEAIVNRELFKQANARFPVAEKKEKRQRKNSEKFGQVENIFSDVVSCGICGKKMKAAFYQSRLTEKRNYTYYCKNAYMKDVRKCEKNSITQKELEEIVLNVIKTDFEKRNLKAKNMTEQNLKYCEGKKQIYRKEINSVQNDAMVQKKQFSLAYMQWKNGEFSQEEYLNKKKQKEDAENFAESRVQELEKKIAKADIRAEEENKFLRALVRANGKKKLTRELVDCLIEKILVHPDKTIDIVFKFKERGDGDE